MPLTGCSNPLLPIPGSGFNQVDVPGPNSKGYNTNTEKLLYEIWQSNLAILAALAPPGMVTVIKFTIGDGQAGTPLSGTTSLHAPAIQGQSIVNKTLLVLRNNIGMGYPTPTDPGQIARHNDGVNGGFDLTVASGLTFQIGDTYEIYVIGINNTIE